MKAHTRAAISVVAPRFGTQVTALLGGLLLSLATSTAPAQQHPALTPPSNFSAGGTGDKDRAFERTLTSGDRLRLKVTLEADGGDADAIAKTRALEPGDQIREETRQEIKIGNLTGIAYSCLGKSETIDGIPYTRYRRVMGLVIANVPVPVAARADILAKEPRPAQSTLEAMASALAEWQNRLGGVSAEPPPDPEAKDPASKPVVGGEQTISLRGGGDLDLRVPAFWGRADITHSQDHLEILVGPAKDVLEKVTLESLPKDKDRIGPYISISRMQRETFKDLIDTQLFDIADSLLADYVARMSDAGVTLTLGQRVDGTLGTRAVISVPFDEKRSSGTEHRGRIVFMMHRGSLAIVLASHPVEKFDEGWPEVAKAFDTLLFVGAPEPETPAPSDPAPGGQQPTTPPEQPTTPPQGPPATGNTPPAGETPPSGNQPPANPPVVEPPPSTTGALRIPPAGPDWVLAAGAMKSIRAPLPTPIEMSIPPSWTLLGEADPARAALAFVATPKPESSADPLQSALRVDYIAFMKQLAVPDPLPRLGALMRLRLEQDARSVGLSLAVQSETQAGLSGMPAHAIQYSIKQGDREATGTFVGTAFDGTVVLADLRIAPAERATISSIATEILNSIKVAANVATARQTFGRYSAEVPADWQASESENAGGGRDIFVRAPSGVDVRFQTASQKRGDIVDNEVLRRVAQGFLVDGLHVLTARDLQSARRTLVPGARAALRFESSGQDVDVVVVAYAQGDQLVFMLRGAPAGYRGRDLAIGARVMKSFAIAGVDSPPVNDGVMLNGPAVARRVVFTRQELDAVGIDGAARSPSSFYVALLPDGTAGVIVERGGKSQNLRATYRIEGDTVTVEGAGVGRIVYRFTEATEALRGEAPGDILIRNRNEEFP